MLGGSDGRRAAAGASAPAAVSSSVRTVERSTLPPDYRLVELVSFICPIPLEAFICPIPLESPIRPHPIPLESPIRPTALESVGPVCTPGLARRAVSADALSPGWIGLWPRALSAALVAVQSMPPCFRHTSPVRGEFDPSLQTTMSTEELLLLLPLLLLCPALLLSLAEGPVWTPGLARSAVSEGAPFSDAPAWPVGWLPCVVSAP